MANPRFHDPLFNRDYMPAALLELPFDARRSHAYPMRPGVAASAVEQGFAPPPVYLPQRFGFRYWKTPPYPTDFPSAVTSPVRAAAPIPVVQRTTHVGLPIADIARAAAMIGASRLPEPTDNLMMNVAIAKGLDPRARALPPSDLNAIGRQQAQLMDDAQVSRFLAREHALAEVRGRIAGLGMLGQANNASIDPAVQAPATQVPPPPPRRSPLVSFAIGAGILLGVVGLVYLGSR